MLSGRIIGHLEAQADPQEHIRRVPKFLLMFEALMNFCPLLEFSFTEDCPSYDGVDVVRTPRSKLGGTTKIIYCHSIF